MNSNSKVFVGVLIAVIIAIGGYFFPQVQSIVGSDGRGTRFPNGISVNSTVSPASNGLRIGANGSEIVEMKSTTCNAATTELPLEATSTDAFTCSVTGVAAGDQVHVTLPSDSGSVFGGFNISYAVASTDTVTFGVQNNTGVATTSFPLATTSVQVLYFDN